ncbi:MAG: phage baseplate assembly protein V [Terracidiphilus sp.]|nr:phage baseplate assembly protein V [Terracidiphilus sp.]
MSGPRPALPTLLPGSGVFSARVLSVHDPENQNRVQVSLSTRDRPDQAIWAEVVVPLGANNRGESFVPGVGDEVLVAFRSADPRLPVILGGLWKGDVPPQDKLGFPGRVVNCSAITGASGTKVSIVEDLSGPTIQITTSSGTNPPTDTVQVSIHMGGSGIEIGAPSSNVVITAAGSVTINAPELNVNAAMANFSGIVKCDVVEANSVIASTYAPGAGNIW